MLDSQEKFSLQSFQTTLPHQSELSNVHSIDMSDIKRPHYGRYLEDYLPNQVYMHPRGYTFTRAGIDLFARTHMQCNPLYLNDEFAKASGYPDRPASPQMVFNVVLSLGVQNDSEKVIANLGYYNARFLSPVYPGDTITAMTKVIERRERSDQRSDLKPGIVTIQTIGINQEGAPVLQYERKLMVNYRGDNPPTCSAPASSDDGNVNDSDRSRGIGSQSIKFPWQEKPQLNLPESILDPANRPTFLTNRESYSSRIKEGQIIVHQNGRTLTSEHFAATFQVGNTHPLHFDQIYSQGLSGKMSGQPIIYGGLVFAWLEGLASRDISDNSCWELGFTEGYHTQPAIAGDTVSAITRVLKIEPTPSPLNTLFDNVTLQLIGVKNISSNEAIDTYGSELFIKENLKKSLGKDKLPCKIFEIERQLLIRRYP